MAGKLSENFGVSEIASGGECKKGVSYGQLLVKDAQGECDCGDSFIWVESSSEKGFYFKTPDVKKKIEKTQDVSAFIQTPSSVWSAGSSSGSYRHIRVT